MGENIKVLAAGLDPTALLKQIEANVGLFEQFKQRQETKGSPHKDTQTIFLRWCESQTIEAAFTQIPAIDYPAYSILTEARPLVDKVLEIVEASELGRVIIPALQPKGVISKHQDEGAYADHYERFHLCLQAQRGCMITVELEERMIEALDAAPGELFWFNHKQNHMCVNPTEAYRLHLIVDAVAPKFRKQRVIRLADAHKRPEPKLSVVSN